MRKVMLEVDWYVKVILTLIVVLLVGILVKPYIGPVESIASGSEVRDPLVGQRSMAELLSGSPPAQEQPFRYKFDKREVCERSEVGRYQLVSLGGHLFGTIDTKRGVFVLWSEQGVAQVLRGSFMQAWYVGDHVTELFGIMKALEEGEENASGEK